MRKLILFLLLSSINLLQAQKEDQPFPNEKDFNLSPDGIFEKVFDHYGNSYKLSDIVIDKKKDSKGNFSRSTDPTPLTCGYYNIYFETGSGMEDSSNIVHMQRRNVLCQVLTDLSNFINSPLSTNGLNNKVNIWVRNINNIITPPNTPNGVLGLASSFYTMPYNTTSGFGGIIDNEIWKTIHLGKDSYTNVISPLTSNGINSGQSGVFYHGMMAFNFSDVAISWNTNLTLASFPNKYDLYSVILHEMTHALGVDSLIDSNGISKFGFGYNYFSRYDTKLKNNASTQFLINKQTNACGNMYNYTFNNSLSTSILQPTSNACANKIRYVGLSDVPVHTPTIFSPASSLCHFEGVCVSPNPGFVMESATEMNTLKRFLQPQERNVLGDLGYSVNDVYGMISTYQGKMTYLGAISGITVAGMNDGITANGNFSYIGVATSANPIIINSSTDSSKRILSNDTNSSAYFECLEDLTDPNAIFSNTSGNGATTNITLSSQLSGLHLLRYIPTNITGTQKGNLTYIYVYVISNNNCGTPTPCNLVVNGGFEQYSIVPDRYTQINRACGWNGANFASPDYFHKASTNPQISIPCNAFGFQQEKDNLNAYVGIATARGYSEIYSENIRTKLTSKLLPNKSYRLSFDLSLPEAYTSFLYNFQAYLSPELISIGTYGYLPIANSDMLFNILILPNATDWKTIVIEFATNNIAGEEYLYLGAIKNISIQSAIPASQNQNCNPQSSLDCYYYLDNVSLTEIGGTLNLPETMCFNESISDLLIYLEATTFNGTFSGNGVSVDSFNASQAGVGVHTISYTYTNSTGCSVTISDQIEVLASNDANCTNNCSDNLIFSSVENASLVTYNASNFIETNGNYITNSSSDVTLKAGNYIVLKPNSQINSGSQFLARIENCDGTQTGKSTTANFETRKKSRPKANNKNEFESKQNSEIEKNPDISGLLIYPNPSKGLVNITTSLNAELQVSIFDMLGKEVVYSRTSNNVLNVSNLTSGVYIIKITEANKIANRRLVIQ